MPFEIQAHRGARAFYPENTIHAFCKAADLGCSVIELDLVVSKDLQVLVSHDPWVAAPGSGADGRRFLYTFDFRDIPALEAAPPPPAFPGQLSVRSSRPALSAVFDQVEAHLERLGRPGRMVYNLEVKSWADLDGIAHPEPERYVELVLAVIRASGIASRVRVQSFDERIVLQTRRQDPGLCLGLLAERPEQLADLPGRCGCVPDYVNPRFDLVDRDLVRRLHRLGAKVVVWTVNTPELMVAMKAFGVDGLITDHPEIALRLPELRGA